MKTITFDISDDAEAIANAALTKLQETAPELTLEAVAEREFLYFIKANPTQILQAKKEKVITSLDKLSDSAIEKVLALVEVEKPVEPGDDVILVATKKSKKTTKPKQDESTTSD